MSAYKTVNKRADPKRNFAAFLACGGYTANRKRKKERNEGNRSGRNRRDASEEEEWDETGNRGNEKNRREKIRARAGRRRRSGPTERAGAGGGAKNDGGKGRKWKRENREGEEYESKRAGVIRESASAGVIWKCWSNISFRLDSAILLSASRRLPLYPKPSARSRGGWRRR